MKRRAATFNPTRCRELTPGSPARRRCCLEKLDRPPGRSPLRRPAGRSLSRAARRCRHLRAVRAPNHLPTHSLHETARNESHPKATFVNTVPCRELTPDDHLAVIPRHPSCRALRRHEHPTNGCGSRTIATDVAAGCDRNEAGPKAIGVAQPRTDPSTGSSKSMTSNLGRRTHPERRQQLPTGPRWCSGRRAR